MRVVTDADVRELLDEAHARAEIAQRFVTNAQLQLKILKRSASEAASRSRQLADDARSRRRAL
jgi:hypothetical protein